MMLRSLVLPLLLITPVALSAKITRDVTKTFTVAPAAKVDVNISGGSIDVTVGAPGQVEAHLIESFHTNSESEADEILARYEVTVAQEGNGIKVAVRPRAGSGGGWFSGWRHQASFSVKLTAPADTFLALDTSGGSIQVDGETTGRLEADTSGGSIDVSGGSGAMNLDTSGGSIKVGRALHKLRADTSGGSIRIGYVGPDVSDLNADTSGGSITIGLDPAGHYDLVADTSGGRVSVDGLTLAATRLSRTHAEGKINGGGGRVRADTSGGSISIAAKASP